MQSGDLSVIKMKGLVFILLSCAFMASFSQKNFEIKVHKNKLVAIKNIREIITEIPADCKINLAILVFPIGGTLKEFQITKEDISWFQKIFKQCVTGSVFYIEKMRSDCPKSLKESYKITVQ